MQNAVLGVIVRPAHGQFLMCRRSSQDRTFGGWCFPGGKVEPQETPEAGLRRELQEELGSQFKISSFLWELGVLYSYSPLLNREFRITVFQTRVYKDQPITLSSEYEESRWVTPEEALTLPLAGNVTRAIIGYHLHGKLLVWPIQNRAPLFPDAPGMFAAQRKHDIHTGIDLYCVLGDRICAVEDGEVIGVEIFTGPRTDPPSPWWDETHAVLVRGHHGVLVYGEVNPLVTVGSWVVAGQTIARIDTPVLKTYKGRPTVMLHFEHMSRFSTQTLWWKLEDPQPDRLINPAGILRQCLGGVEPPTFNLSEYKGDTFR